MKTFDTCESVLNLSEDEKRQVQEFLNLHNVPGRNVEEDCAPSDNYYFVVRGSSIGPCITVCIDRGPKLEVDSNW